MNPTSPPSLEAQLGQVQKQSIATAIQHICTHAETYYEAVRRAAHLAGARPEMFLLRAVFALDLTRIAVPRGGAIPLASLPNAATEPPRLRRAVPQLFTGLEASFQETLQRLAATIDIHRQFVCWVTVEGEGMATHDIGRSVHAGAVIDALDHRPTWVGHLGGRMGSGGDNTVPPNQFSTTADGRVVPNVAANFRLQQQPQQHQRGGFASPQQQQPQQQYYQDPFVNSPSSSSSFYQQHGNNNPFQSMTPQQQKEQYQQVLSSIKSGSTGSQQQQQQQQQQMMTTSQTMQSTSNQRPFVPASQYFAAGADAAPSPSSPAPSNVISNNHKPWSSSSATMLDHQHQHQQQQQQKSGPLPTATASPSTFSSKSATNRPQIPDTLQLDHLDKIDEFLAVSHMCTKASTKCLEHLQSFNIRLDELHNYTSSLSEKFDENRIVAKDLDQAVELLMQKLQTAEKNMLLLESPKPVTQMDLMMKKKDEDDEDRTREERRVQERAREEAGKMLAALKAKNADVAVQTDPVLIGDEAAASAAIARAPQSSKRTTPTGAIFSKLDECTYCDEPATKFCKNSGRRHETVDEKAERRWRHLFRQMSLMASFVSTARLSKGNSCVSDGGIELVL